MYCSQKISQNFVAFSEYMNFTFLRIDPNESNKMFFCNFESEINEPNVLLFLTNLP